MLSAGIIVVIVQRELSEDAVKLVALSVVVILLLLIPEMAEYIKHRKDKEG